LLLRRVRQFGHVQHYRTRAGLRGRPCGSSPHERHHRGKLNFALETHSRRAHRSDQVASRSDRLLGLVMVTRRISIASQRPASVLYLERQLIWTLLAPPARGSSAAGAARARIDAASRIPAVLVLVLGPPRHAATAAAAGSGCLCELQYWSSVRVIGSLLASTPCGAEEAAQPSRLARPLLLAWHGGAAPADGFRAATCLCKRLRTPFLPARVRYVRDDAVRAAASRRLHELELPGAPLTTFLIVGGSPKHGFQLRSR